ncbi:cytochrome b5 reductase 4 isoform X2 [Salvelinus namaycush]|uniref:Cytochrome b5 reductase 4 isoform X2 n=1 Tax=Salvelinus namaycush TaxID=8040 RepID=A0A8U0PXD9_SALNM|nr:cytochrome b5 reductase 4 isoform X2 [Salvelinus namaycush]
MLNVPSQSFPAASSQQRVAPAGQSGRNKVALKPGHSLMDWIRVAKSGRDLTGLRGRLIDVTEEELQKHNTRDDCWTCIRGMVYNVSPYMDFHPGGEEELMKAAGKDGTDLFDQVHRWVNYESMLKECMVGRMAVKASTALKAHSVIKDSITHLNGLAPPPPPTSMLPPAFLTPPSPSSSLQPSAAPPPTQPKDARPRYDWFQTDVTVNIVVYTKRKLPSSGCTIVDLQDGVLRVEVLLGKMSYILRQFHTACAVGKIQVSMRKAAKGKWEELGEPLEFHDSLFRKKDRAIFYRECILVSKTAVTHDTWVFRLQLPLGTLMHVPVGKHIYLKSLIQDSEVVKPYTPVEETLVPATLDSTQGTAATDIFLMIKVYPDGVLTPHLNNLNIGDHLSVSSPDGPFSLRLLREVTHLYLLAAGTGFTPMARVIRLALQDLGSLRKTKLMFFNRQERDILWHSELDGLAAEDERFQVEYILSEPCDGWTGRKGRVEASMLTDFLVRPEGSKVFVCVCGPSAFAELTVGLVRQHCFSEEEIHVFQG